MQIIEGCHGAKQLKFCVGRNVICRTEHVLWCFFTHRTEPSMQLNISCISSYGVWRLVEMIVMVRASSTILIAVISYDFLLVLFNLWVEQLRILISFAPFSVRIQGNLVRYLPDATHRQSNNRHGQQHTGLL